MIIVVNADNRGLVQADLVEMFRQRGTVLVDGADWILPVVAGQEMDCYDCDDTKYILANEGLEGSLLASLRLLPTRPHLSSDLLLRLRI